MLNSDRWYYNTVCVPSREDFTVRTNSHLHSYLRHYRPIMVDWIYQCVEEEEISVFHNDVLTRMKIFQLAVRIYDAARIKTNTTNWQLFQLYAVVSMGLAIKLCGPLEISDLSIGGPRHCSLLSDLTDFTYSWKSINRAESDVMNALDWNLNLPTPLDVTAAFCNDHDVLRKLNLCVPALFANPDVHYYDNTEVAVAAAYCVRHPWKLSYRALKFARAALAWDGLPEYTLTSTLRSMIF